MEFQQMHPQHRRSPLSALLPALRRWWHSIIAIPPALSPSEALRATLLQMVLVIMIGLGYALLLISVVSWSWLGIVLISGALPCAFLAWCLNRRGHWGGIWLFITVNAVCILVAYPALALVAPSINPPLLFALPALLAAVFLRPRHLIAVVVVFYGAVTMKLVLAHIAPSTIATFVAYALVDTCLFLAPTLIILGRLEHALQRELRANADLRALNASLDAQVAARTREGEQVNLSLERVNIALQHAHAAQTQWLDARREQTTNAAHDQKGELVALVAAVQGIDAVLEEYDVPAAARADYEAQVMASVDAIDRLVTALVTAAQLESHALALSLGAVDVGRTLDAVAQRMQAVCQRHGVTLQRVATLAPTLAVADAAQLERMVANLIDNARKHHYPHEARQQCGVDPTIGIWVASHTQGVVGIVIADNGPGIADLARVRQRWAQGRDAAPGTGLGLSLCEALARQMGGRLELQSTVGVGTTATIILPAHHEAPHDEGWYTNPHSNI